MENFLTPRPLVALYKFLSLALFGGLAKVMAPYVHANWVTGFRVFLTPFIIWAVMSEHGRIGLGLYILGWWCDIFDGILARKRAELRIGDDEAVGQVFDALSDKVFVIPILLTFAFCGEYLGMSHAWWWASWLIVLGVVFTEGILFAIRVEDYFTHNNGHKAGLAGKFKAWVQGFGVGGYLLSYPHMDQGTTYAGVVLLAISLLYGALSLRSKLKSRRGTT